MFGPVPDSSKDIFKKVSVGLVAGDYSASTGTRDIIYKEPVATKSYAGNLITNLSVDISDSDGLFEVEDSTNIPVKSYITIDDETLYVNKKEGNILYVTRGSYKTQSSEHVGGSAIYLITSADNQLIVAGDDFGFSG